MFPINRLAYESLCAVWGETAVSKLYFPAPLGW